MWSGSQLPVTPVQRDSSLLLDSTSTACTRCTHIHSDTPSHPQNCFKRRSSGDPHDGGLLVSFFEKHYPAVFSTCRIAIAVQTQGSQMIPVTEKEKGRITQSDPKYWPCRVTGDHLLPWQKKEREPKNPRRRRQNNGKNTGENIKAAQEKPEHQEGRAFGLQSTTGTIRRMTGDLCDPQEGEDGMTSEEAILGGFLPHRDGPLLRTKLSPGHARNPHPRK